MHRFGTKQFDLGAPYTLSYHIVDITAVYDGFLACFLLTSTLGDWP